MATSDVINSANVSLDYRQLRALAAWRNIRLPRLLAPYAGRYHGLDSYLSCSASTIHRARCGWVSIPACLSILSALESPERVPQELVDVAAGVRVELARRAARAGISAPKAPAKKQPKKKKG